MKTTLLITLLTLSACQPSAQPGRTSRPPQSVLDPATPAALDAAAASIDQSRRTAITRAVEAATPAVVSVNVIEVRQVRLRDPFAGDPFFEQFFGRRPDRVYQQEVQGVGSGFVISPDGYIVTNDHVAGNATKITVALPDGSQLPATLVGTDPETDVALLKVEPDRALPYLAFEDQVEPLVGEWAIALGNPFGLFEAADPSVTVGVVSAVNRDFPTQQGRVFRDMIQTDAAINQGNSGGPLVNALGHVIGVNTFIYSPSGGSVGLGFAVPAWRVQRVVEELRARGSVDRAFYTGLNVRPVNPRIAEALGLPEARGLIVASVDPDSPADDAGLRPYDVVVAINGEAVATNDDVRQRLLDYRAGDTITLAVVREGRPLDVRLRLGRVG
ncbi:MAG TPA: trypsin-like peptidase domain-containing protein [Rubricoccaceae bacterium]|nr:trypsin-like peptidase domain-containing protein [Rubricoccaceae bacterium]